MHIHTPLIRSLPLSDACQTNVWLKFDALQPSGSFKLRGMSHKALIEKQKGAQKFVSSSGGNAGLAVAYAGMELGVSVSVYVPGGTKAATVEKLKLCGAKVVTVGEHWAQAHEEAEKELDDPAAVYFHPFDDHLVWQGHSTLVDEVMEDGLRPDLVICSVGGGGLLCGMVSGLQNHGLHSTGLLGIETVGADSLFQSSVRGKHVELAKITSRASSLGAVKVCKKAYELLSNPLIHSDIVLDSDAEEACHRFLTDHRIKVELACGAALAAVYTPHYLVKKCDNVLVVVCGGVND
ncbi:MAG: pyridoxal-phosphate dependent enzyme [Gammaproteobacteria bacterium]|nr:pyridoxal-phosphate dependent enzyme [Gammaproteobacteria bacterium]